MTKKSCSLLTLSAAAFLVACGGNPPSTPAPEAVQAVAVQPTATDKGLSDKRAMELARGYVALVHARGAL